MSMSTNGPRRLCRFQWSDEAHAEHKCGLEKDHLPPHECDGSHASGDCNATCDEAAPDDGDDLVAEHFGMRSGGAA